MRKQNYLTAFVLIGVGLYFFLQQLHIPILAELATWPTLLVIIGVSLLLHSYLTRDHDKLFPGVILLGLGIHFLAVSMYPNWVEHWSVYAIIIGLAFLVRYQKTKSGLYAGLATLLIGLFMLLTITNNQFSTTIQQFIGILEDYWPISLIILGIYLLIKRK
ncbi:hypothetical protein SAMN04488134_1134 [Amphibacillus marinus]|uniref:LiaI-LiaF-like transmembrane region domain-containing protein n=1 Tax=Amphibacillus marinus TaxID=872970 RepID=A0A1H8SJ50_9BACI|nr:DUF5668 domain-containing protein [Amphibacillus marinus]SEO78702.1 hypothetical protein SAMN04488134_1134 [Amphibacillus marinus]